MLDVGDVVLSKAGRDKERLFFITEVKDNYIYLVDGDIHKIENPKLKKVKHVETTNFHDEIVAHRLINKNKIINQDIKKSLKKFYKNLGGSNV